MAYRIQSRLSVPGLAEDPVGRGGLAFPDTYSTYSASSSSASAIDPHRLHGVRTSLSSSWDWGTAVPCCIAWLFLSGDVAGRRNRLVFRVPRIKMSSHLFVTKKKKRLHDSNSYFPNPKEKKEKLLLGLQLFEVIVTTPAVLPRPRIDRPHFAYE